jgi:hypothetical protein
MELPALKVAHIAERGVGDTFATRRFSATLGIGRA